MSATLTDDLFAALTDTHDTAAVSLFLQLLRDSPNLRHWLRSAFFNPQTRQRLDACLSGTLSIPSHARTGQQLLAWLAGADRSRLREIALLQTHDIAARQHGGLTRAQVVQLIRHYQAGSLPLAPFLFALAWRNAPADAPPAPALHVISARYFQECFAGNGGQPRLIRQLAKAAEYFHGQPIGTITRAHYGYGAWWRLSLLHYILNHPKPRYRTGEFSRHLAAQKITVEMKDIRRFCTKHGIARDQAPGRPTGTSQ